MGCARRACRVSLNPSTRRRPTAWAWASRSAARLSKTTEGGCGRHSTSLAVLCFSLLSPRLQANRDHVDVPLWPISYLYAVRHVEAQLGHARTAPGRL